MNVRRPCPTSVAQVRGLIVIVASLAVACVESAPKASAARGENGVRGTGPGHAASLENSTTPSCEGGACGVGPPSCAPGGLGMTDCGAQRESCCMSLKVEGGTYYRVYDDAIDGGGATLVSDGAPTGEAAPATVSDFRLDKYVVTVGRFRQFVAAWNGGAGYLPTVGSGKHTHLNGGLGLANSGAVGNYESGWRATYNVKVAPSDYNLVCGAAPNSTWANTPNGRENQPITCVNWFEAYAFCIWDGGFLPSEAEWEYAAARGDEQREDAWGSTDPGATNKYANYGGGASAVAPVGTAAVGAGRWGQLYMVGDVFEWNMDWSAPYIEPCVDCAYLTRRHPGHRVVRGGGTYIRPPFRGASPPSYRYHGFYRRVGIRCARTP